MAYNRLGQPDYHGDDYQGGDLGYGHGQPQHPQSPFQDPQHQSHMHGYQLEDTNPAFRPPPAPLQMPVASTDRLVAQPTYSVENVHSYPADEHFDQRQFDQRHHYQVPDAGGYGYAGTGDHVVTPEEHAQAYYQRPYEPQHQDSFGYGQTPVSEPSDPYYHDDDQQPIMSAPNAYGPDPNTVPQEPLVDRPQTSSPANPPLRRWKTVKDVQLFNGNLVLDCPIAPRLLNSVPHAAPPDRDEFTHMRYSAATCDPKDFAGERFTLRQKLFAKPRKTELFIVVTMYNEDEVLFARTMIGVFKNIANMCGRTNSKTWGKEAWKKIVVCVVSDGRAKINPRTRAVLAGLGCYQDGIAKEAVNGKPVTAHIYEYTTQVGMELKGDVVSLKPKGDTPVQMLFCLKEKNQKKINSHRWFFQAFGRVLDPNICVLIDAGTRPGKDSIYQLWKAFDLEPMCGGACGEIKVMTNHGLNVLKSPLVAAQNFEYKMSNILDKPLESAFGFISVLPGAFSAYRYVALQNDKNEQGPLERYFAGEKLHGGDAGIFTANMYLAEDRILCWELVTKRNCRWVLQYVKSSSGETDVPDAMAEFILQRRRWLNGSFFAAVYAIAHFYQIGRSEHSFGRKSMLCIEFIYQTINMLFAWFALANFFLVFHILTFSLAATDLLGNAGNVLAIIFEWFYLGVLLSCVVLSLGNTPKGSNKLYMSMVIFWAVIMAYLMFASIFITVKSVQTQVSEAGFTFSDLFTNALFRTLIISMLSTYVLWIVASLLFFDPWHMITSFIQYLLLTPTYINILNVYAFCNTHDVSWGTKGDVKPPELGKVTVGKHGKVTIDHPQDDGDLNEIYERELKSFNTKAPKEEEKIEPEEKQKAYYAGFRSATVLAWMFSNLGLAAVVLDTGGLETVDTSSNANQAEQQNATIYMAVVLYSVAGLAAFRFVGAVYFLLKRMFHGV